MPGRHQDDVADCRNRFWPETSARREFELIRLLTEEGTEQMRRLWLRKCSNTSNLYQHAAGQPSHRRAAARPPAQQNAGRQPEPAPAQAQAVPKPKTAAQLARRQRSLIRLQQKHLARALARERTARGLRVSQTGRSTLASSKKSVLLVRAAFGRYSAQTPPPSELWVSGGAPVTASANVCPQALFTCKAAPMPCAAITFLVCFIDT
jgi:hypothetical protein